MGRHLRTLFITALWVFLAGLSYAQQGGGLKEYWFSYGRTNKDVEVLFGDTAAYYELHITSRFRTSGIIVFTHNKDTVPFTVTPGTAFVHRLSYSQRGATYHDKTGKFDLSACVLCDHEVSVSTIARMGFSTDAGLILPAHALGTGYRVMMTEPDLGSLLLIATQDGTVIRLNGNPLCTLDRGETYYWINSLAASKLQGGEQLEGDKPFVCLFTQIMGWIPHNIPSADQLYEQCFPQKLLGTEYYVPVSVMGEDYVQVMATEPNTNLTLSGGRVSVNQFRNGITRLTGLNAGQWVWIKVGQQDSGCLIRSDKPVILFTYLAAHCNFPNVSVSAGGYCDPSAAAVPETGRRVTTCIFRPYKTPVDVFSTFPPKHYALVALPTYGKDSTRISIGNGPPQPLSGGIWRDHPSGWSYYNVPLPSDSGTYTITNGYSGMQVYNYGITDCESYDYLASANCIDLRAAFYGNGFHNLELPSMRICEQEVVFRAEVYDSLSSRPGHIRWFVDSIEVTEARDSMEWRHFFTRGKYKMRLEVIYYDDFTHVAVESELNVTRLELQTSTTPERCGRSDGIIRIMARSDYPVTLEYYLDSAEVYEDSVTGLKAGQYLLRVRDAYCELYDTIRVDSVRGPAAAFGMDPLLANAGMQVRFTDSSAAGDMPLSGWWWDFGDREESWSQHPLHAYRDSGRYTVMLVVSDAGGCTDTARQELRIVKGICFPNAYAPIREDGNVQYFKPMEENMPYRTFEMLVYNRWGNVVWRQSCKGGNCPDYADDGFWWDGCGRDGKTVSAGVYFWVVKATFDELFPPLTQQGSVTVFR